MPPASPEGPIATPFEGSGTSAARWTNVVPPGPERGTRPPGSPAWPVEKGLFWWLVALLVFGAGGALLGQQELAGLVAISGLFVAAQAADHDARWRGLYYALSWVVPAGAALTFASMTVLLYQGDLPGWPRWFLIALSLASALACLATVFRPVSDALARRLLHADPPTHSLRLSARLVLAGLLLVAPGWFALRDYLAENMEQLVEQLPLGGGLAGYVILALAAVGFLVRRDLPTTLARLGVGPLRLPHLAVVALGVAGLLALNSGADWIQRHAFPDLWSRDQAFNETLASGLSRGQALMLGLSAGVGEEITMRGALQPKLGIVLTSLLFAALHVQYSWFGMGVIFLFGLILGVMRRRTNTSVVMAVHTLYDIVAIFSI